MNRHHRRAEAAEGRKRTTAHDKAATVAEALHYLARIAAPTATGATILFPDGSTAYLSADDARALYGDKPARGHA